MLSSNAKFDTDGWAQLIRDVERLYLLIGNGSSDMGGGSPVAASDQLSADDGAVGSQLATRAQLDDLSQEVQGIQRSIPAGVSSYYFYGLGNPGALSSGFTDIALTSLSGNATSAWSGSTFTAPKSGIYAANFRYGFSVLTNGAIYELNSYIEITAPYGSVNGGTGLNFPSFNATGLTRSNQTYVCNTGNMWNGYLAAGETLAFRVYNDAATASGTYRLYITGTSV